MTMQRQQTFSPRPRAPQNTKTRVRTLGTRTNSNLKKSSDPSDNPTVPRALRKRSFGELVLFITLLISFVF